MFYRASIGFVEYRKSNKKEIFNVQYSQITKKLKQVKLPSETLIPHKK